MRTSKAKLKLARNKKEAWNRFTQTINHRPSRHQAPGPEMAQLSTPRRIDRMRALRKGMDAMNTAMDQRDRGHQTFYATLNPEQKTFDAEHARMNGSMHTAGMQDRMGAARGKVRHKRNPEHSRPC